MISVSLKELENYLNQQVETSKKSIGNDILVDKLDINKMIRLYTKIQVLEEVRSVFIKNKEEH